MIAAVSRPRVDARGAMLGATPADRAYADLARLRAESGALVDRDKVMLALGTRSAHVEGAVARGDYQRAAAHLSALRGELAAIRRTGGTLSAAEQRDPPHRCSAASASEIAKQLGEWRYSRSLPPDGRVGALGAQVVEVSTSAGKKAIVARTDGRTLVLRCPFTHEQFVFEKPAGKKPCCSDCAKSGGRCGGGGAAQIGAARRAGIGDVGASLSTFGLTPQAGYNYLLDEASVASGLSQADVNGAANVVSDVLNGDVQGAIEAASGLVAAAVIAAVPAAGVVIGAAYAIAEWLGGSPPPPPTCDASNCSSGNSACEGLYENTYGASWEWGGDQVQQGSFFQFAYDALIGVWNAWMTAAPSGSPPPNAAGGGQPDLCWVLANGWDPIVNANVQMAAAFPLILNAWNQTHVPADQVAALAAAAGYPNALPSGGPMTVNVNYGGSTTGWQGAPAGNDPISVALNAYAIGAKLPASFGSDIVSITFQVNSIYKWSDFGLSGPPPVPPNATCPPGSYPEADSSQPSGYRCIESSVGGTNQPGTAASSGTSTGAKVAAALAVPALVAAGIGAHALATGGTYAGSAKAAWGGTKSFAVGGLQRLSALKVPL